MDTGINGENYIDVDDALKRVGGNMGLYKRLLGRFIEGNHFEALDSAIQKGDFEEAERMAHTLKGVGANLSLIKLTAVSTELEQLIKNSQDYTACLANLKQAYDVTLEKIAEITG